MKPAAPRAPAPTPATPATAVAGERSFDTKTLFDGMATVTLTHQGQRYLLRITRQGKLILTK